MNSFIRFLNSVRTDADYAAFAAQEAIIETLGPDCGHAAAETLARHIADLFADVKRETAAHALAVALLPYLRPGLFKPEVRNE